MYVNTYVHAHTHTYTLILITFFPHKPGLVGPLTFLIKGFSVKFYGPDDPPGTSQQKHTGLHIFCNHCDSWRGRGVTSFCIGFLTPVLHYLQLVSPFIGHFPGGPGLASTRMSPLWVLLELRVTEMVTTGAVRHSKLQSNHHHQQTNILQARCLSCRPTNSVWALKEKTTYINNSAYPRRQ